jgi:ribosomal protein L7/L12
MAGIWDLIMEALAETHDGSVQMIDTSIVRVHQHGGCARGGTTRLMGRSRGGLTTKIHACILNALQSGEKIRAISLYRAIHGGSLKDAKEFIEEIERQLSPPTS